MTWRVKRVEEQRFEFIQAYLEKKFNFSDLCKQFNISRPCGYKWLDRYEQEGIIGLKDKDKTPLNSPLSTSNELVNEILNLKYQWPKWGPKKILGYLAKTQSGINWPSLSTVENILKKNGLVERRKLRKRFAKKTDPLGICNASNDIWCMDFKGWWLTKDHRKCEPFTLTDAYSRYLLSCQQLISNDTHHVWAVFETLFREFGLPLRIRSDNGSPFASKGPGRLSKLSINLIKAGVAPEWIEPGNPQQNGRHERMHSTLKREALELEADWTSQLKKLNEFIEYYNFIRPHEALNQKCPGEVYEPSERYWDGKLKSPEYSNEYRIGRVKKCGKMSWKNREIYIGRAFAEEEIGIREEYNGHVAYYGSVYLGIISTNNLEFERRSGRVK